MQKAERLIYLALIIGLLIGFITVGGLGAAVYVGWRGANHRADYWETHYSIATNGWKACLDQEK